MTTSPATVELYTCSCGDEFELRALFGHECPVADRARRFTDDRQPEMPARNGSGSSSATGHRANKFAAPCSKCGATVEAGAGRLDRSGDKWLVSHLGECPAPAQDAPEAALAAVLRRNRFAAPCHRCGVQIAAEAGLLARSASGSWIVGHDGECPAKPAASSTPVTLPDVPAGHYAIASKGHNDLAFYRVDRPTEGEYAGRTFVKLMVGGHPDQNVRRDAVAGILARILEAGVAEAAHLYGTEIGRCYACNRTLTDQESRRLGIGPECRKKH